MSKPHDSLPPEVVARFREAEKYVHDNHWRRAVENAKQNRFDKNGFAECLKFSARLKDEGADVSVPPEALMILADHLLGNGPRCRDGVVEKSILVDIACNQYRWLCAEGMNSESAIAQLAAEGGVSDETIRDWLYPNRGRRKK